VTEAGVQSCSYLFFDGADGMETGTITPGTNKVQMFAGVRKLSDAVSYAVMVETSAQAGGFNGTFALYAPYTAATYGFITAGTAQGSAVTGASFAAPRTDVLTGLGDISGDLATLRANGTQAAQVTTDQRTGNYLAYPLYIGRRANGTLPFNGQIYGLITRFGTNLDAATINATEYWVGDKTGINIANNTSATIFARDDTAVLDRFNQIIERRA
jgi:hypothetical protein